MQTENKYNVIIPVALGDVDALLLNVKYIKQNLPVKQIIIIGNDKVKKEIENVDDDQIDFINENTCIRGVNFESVKALLISRIGEGSRCGWYLQQFIKLGYSRITDEKSYLVWDSDTIPLKKIEFCTKMGKKYFTLKKEYNQAYFNTINKLLGIEKCIEGSFIAEHMLFDTEITKELLERIESNSLIAGVNFAEKIINSIELKDLALSGFSEFETYGNYVMTYYRECYAVRSLKTLREGKKIIYQMTDKKALEWVGKHFDTVTFERKQELTYLGNLTKYDIVRKMIPSSIFYNVYRILRKLGLEK